MDNVSEQAYGGKRVIVVLGMHRGGTSVLARGLQALGGNLGDSLIPPGSDNPKGFYEDAGFRLLNERLLRALGHDWDTLAPILPREMARPLTEEFARQAAALVTARLSAAEVFAVKDPRMARLLPFWQEIFARLEVPVSYAIAVRNPLCVVESLAQRRPIPREKAYFLWLEHMFASMELTAGQPRVVVAYDRLVQEPGPQLERVARALHLHLDPQSPLIAEYQRDFIEPELCHHNQRMEQLKADQAAPLAVISFYQTLSQVAGDAFGIEDARLTAALTAAGDLLANSFSALRYLDETAGYLNHLTARTRAGGLAPHGYRALRSFNANGDALAAATEDACRAHGTAAWRMAAPMLRAGNSLRKALKARKARKSGR
ncbi:MAG: sulfotransferase family protein [Terriglobales bacterium]